MSESRLSHHNVCLWIITLKTRNILNYLLVTLVLKWLINCTNHLLSRHLIICVTCNKRIRCGDKCVVGRRLILWNKGWNEWIAILLRTTLLGTLTFFKASHWHLIYWNVLLLLLWAHNINYIFFMILESSQNTSLIIEITIRSI